MRTSRAGFRTSGKNSATPSDGAPAGPGRPSPRHPLTPEYGSEPPPTAPLQQPSTAVALARYPGLPPVTPSFRSGRRSSARPRRTVRRGTCSDRRASLLAGYVPWSVRRSELPGGLARARGPCPDRGRARCRGTPSVPGRRSDTDAVATLTRSARSRISGFERVPGNVAVDRSRQLPARAPDLLATRGFAIAIWGLRSSVHPGTNRSRRARGSAVGDGPEPAAPGPTAVSGPPARSRAPAPGPRSPSSADSNW